MLPGKKVLAIVPQDDLYSKLESLFARTSINVTRATTGTSSLILATNITFDLIVSEYPLPDLSIVDFLEILGSPTLPSADSPVILLTEDDQALSLAEHLSSEQVQVAPRSSPEEALQNHVARCLGISTRKLGRVLVQLRVEGPFGDLQRACQTSNISESGMLIHTSRLMPVDSELELTFHLPGDPRPIDGVVKVVRHTDPAREKLAGMGVTFLRLPEGARQRLLDYVNGRLVLPEEEEVPPLAMENPPAVF